MAYKPKTGKKWIDKYGDEHTKGYLRIAQNNIHYYESHNIVLYLYSEEADIEKKKPGLAQYQITDIKQEEFDSYFGNCVLDQEGVNTKKKIYELFEDRINKEVLNDKGEVDNDAPIGNGRWNEFVLTDWEADE